jgi:glycosyltransferase involved in cell wall biosynthesis
MDRDKKITVVFGINDFLSGGAQKQFCRQLKYFDRNRFRIVLVTLFEFKGKRNLYDLLPNDLEIHRLKFKGWYDIKSWFELWGILQKIKPNIVVSSLFFSNTVFRVLKPLLGYISIPREHNTYIHKPKTHQFIDRILSKLSYQIVAVSDTVAKFTSKQENIPAEKFRVIHNGIDLDLINKELPDKDSLKRELGLLSTDKVLINIGRLTSQKNHKLLIDSFATFNDKYPEYKLLIVGEGSLRQKLENQVKDLGEKNSVKFAGHQDNVWKFIKISDFFVSTSKIEGLSNAYLEALLGGLPIVATKTAGTDELIQDGKNGFFIKEGNKEMVLEALEKMHNIDLASFSDHAVEAATKFSIEETVKKYEELFEEAIF